MARLKGKIAVVTGGASGIGLATSALMAEEGAIVVMADINHVKGEAAAKATPNAVFLAHDAGEEESWQRLIREVLDRFGRLDILVNNAAISGVEGPMADPESTTVANWRAIQRVNLEGVFLGCKHAIAAMKSRGGGAIVNVSSGGAIIPSPLNTPYGAAKAGVLNLTITVAIHCAVKSYGIRCNAVLPGGTRTPMLLGLFETVAAGTGARAKDVEQGFAQKAGLGRLAEPREIANAIVFLASDEASYINAELLVVDAGRRWPTLLA
ncbi:MAG TPA: SDR family oxidoreductase [Steroidobacteraceae bacterium]|nr:SDR family oxidoreductase [Steroidobacteraceae bacterium]